MIEIRNLSKSFVTSDGPVDALKNVNLTINNGDIYGIIGMSGAGKSTLVRCINMLERPTEGNILLDGRDLGSLNKKELREVRHRVTMIFQGFNLLMQRTCLKNVILPLRLSGVPKAEAEKRGRELLEIVGLPDKANAYPAQLSGGQQQRVAIARALATDPQVLLCDEATSALDPKTTHQILDLIRDINKKLGITVIVITHQMSVVQEICNRVAILEHGAVVEEGEVAQVFADPKADATRHLVYPEMADSVAISDEHGQRVRIIFNGGPAAKTPLIAQMAMEVGVAASILGASTRSVGERAYGYILLEIPGGPDELAKAVNFLRKTPDVTVSVEVNYGENKGVEA
ncbi:MAG: ATP-binding cassette domain-containing protein [Clostridia bacterium]|nr:ATP-binding cassette domain-containing protein [Clostridia bacterium]MBQ7304876.1 ATP-binding cassette domain-containing protein [Clostridia bacterium]MBQ7845038.1 ATP-binding cassette domain-containing protein [Clostridia bacterium]MBQ7866427.1 ATP-binding cassette domain-containing protein [Clostridia bacterium]